MSHQTIGVHHVHTYPSLGLVPRSRRRLHRRCNRHHRRCDRRHLHGLTRWRSRLGHPIRAVMPCVSRIKVLKKASATLSSSFKTIWQIQRSATTRMKPSVCQKGGSIYINYFNIKIYIHTPLLAGVLLLFRGFRVCPFDSLHRTLIHVHKTPKPAWLQGSRLARCPAKYFHNR